MALMLMRPHEDSGTFDHHDHGQLNKSENFGCEKVYYNWLPTFKGDVTSNIQVTFNIQVTQSAVEP